MIQFCDNRIDDSPSLCFMNMQMKKEADNVVRGFKIPRKTDNV